MEEWIDEKSKSDVKEKLIYLYPRFKFKKKTVEQTLHLYTISLLIINRPSNRTGNFYDSSYTTFLCCFVSITMPTFIVFMFICLKKKQPFLDLLHCISTCFRYKIKCVPIFVDDEIYFFFGAYSSGLGICFKYESSMF